MRSLSFSLIGTTQKKLPRGLRIFGMHVVPSSVAASYNGYYAVRLIDNNDEKDCAITEHPVVFSSFGGSKVDIFNFAVDSPMLKDPIYIQDGWLSSVASTCDAVVTLYVL